MVLLLCPVLLSAPSLAAEPRQAAENVEVSGRRVLLQDILQECAREACEIDLAEAPPPGRTLVLQRGAIVKKVRRALPGFTGEGLREQYIVVAATVQRSPLQIEKWLWPDVVAALPKGALLRRIEVADTTQLPAAARAAGVTLPRLPRRAGPAKVGAHVLFEREGVVVSRLPLVLHLQLDSAAARPHLERGGEVELSIEGPGAVIGARAVALRALWVGDTGLFEVLSTGKHLMGRLVEPSRAIVIGAR